MGLPSYDYDIVVVGAGPAGSLAARAAAESGAKTLLLERDAVIGTPVRCGEAIALRNVTRFLPLEDRWIAARVKGIKIYAPDGTEVPVHAPDEVGLVLERSLFDRYLAEMAAGAGANVLTRADVGGLIGENGSIGGVTYRRFGRQHRVKAAVVIAADGVESRVGRWAGIHTQIKSDDLESAYQYYVSGMNYDYEHCHFFLGNEVAPGGYIWVFPKGEHTASIGIGVEVRRCDAGQAHRLLVDFIRRRFGKVTFVGELAGGVPVALPLKKPYRNGIILAGDAARHCNPLTGGGIGTAMVAGWNAGQLAAEGASKGDVSAGFFRRYDEMLDEPILKPHKRAYRLAEAVGKLSDDTMNATAHEVLSIPDDQRTLRTIFLKGLKDNPKLMLDIIRAFV